MSPRKKKPMDATIEKIPPTVQPIPARQAAAMLQCSMGHIRWLRRTGRLKGWIMGGRFAMLDYHEVKALARERAKALKEGRKLGAPSRGFSPDT
jgi:hypothetical protein